MKFTLKDYQEEAVGAVLASLRKASRFWHDGGDRSAFSLTATTGAGKTVMAAAALEALFHGSDQFDFDKDPGAVVIWFSDDPSLNEQSRFRLLEASDMLSLSDMLVVDNTFNNERFAPGRIYFLNTQKLGKSSLLGRGHDPSDPGIEAKDGQPVMPDRRSFTIWDTIRNTIEDPSLTLYLVLDEAHRGMKGSNGSSERQTIVRRLINGSGSVPGIPIVMGISATVERFNKAMTEMTSRLTLPSVVVDGEKVQASGLLKDDINLDVPKATGQYDKVLVGRATEKLKEISKAWEEYAAAQGDAKVVKPLMVIQVANTPDPDEIGRVLDTAFEKWPDLARDSVAHVFGDHTEQTFGRYRVPYVRPERVQEEIGVRILIAKDAISTGWDCPRAEVMVSFRRAQDATHVTQLLGRMIRTPLARRIAGDGRLNAVDCILPFFDRGTVEGVVAMLTKGDDGNEGLIGRRVLVNSEEMRPNPAVPEDVWAKFVTLPSQALPRRQGNPIRRLTGLAHELAFDGLLKDAGKKAHRAMHAVLNGARARFSDKIAEASQSVMTVQGETYRRSLSTGEGKFVDFVEAADQAVIDDFYRKAAREISPDLARTYERHLAFNEGDADDPEQALMDARTIVATLGLVPEIVQHIESEASSIAQKWLDEYRVAIKGLPDARQQIYRDYRMTGKDPLDIDLVRPRSSMQPSTARDKDDSEITFPRYPKHLLCGADGLFPMKTASSWEDRVLAEEMKAKDFIAWYRNPSNGGDDSLGAYYEHGDRQGIVRPDFIFFTKARDGSIVANIVDPHGTHFNDALPKLIGLANYAERHGSSYHRIEAVARIDDGFRVLDLTEAQVRAEIKKCTAAEPLYRGSFARPYAISLGD